LGKLSLPNLEEKIIWHFFDDPCGIGSRMF